MQEQPFAIGAVGHFIAQDPHQRTALVLAHPGKAQRLAGLLLVIEQGAATGVQRAQRQATTCGCRLAEPNSNPCEINNLPDEGRAVAGDASRHFCTEIKWTPN